jgi:transcription elongation factor SPT6
LKAETDGLLKIEIRVDEEARLLADIQKFICNYYENELADQWNAERKLIAEKAAREIIFPQAVKWLKDRLGGSASDYISAKCFNSMLQKLRMQPFKGPDSDIAPTVFSISWGDGSRNAPTFGVVLNENGQVIESIKLDKLTDREHMEDISSLVKLLNRHKPALICYSGFKPNTKIYLYKILVDEVITKYRSDYTNSIDIPVKFIDDEVARIYMNSKTGIREFPEKDYPFLVRYCVSLGRYCQEPLLEYAVLCNLEEDIKNVTLDPLQNLVFNC